MSEPLLECRVSEGSWIWSGSLTKKRAAADRLAERVFETWRSLNAIWPDMPQNVERMSVPKTGQLRIILDRAPKRYPWGTDVIGIVNGFDVTVVTEEGILTPQQRAAYLRLYGQWHLRRAIDVAHTGGHQMALIPSREPYEASDEDVDLAKQAVGSFFAAKDPDMTLEVCPPSDRDWEYEEKFPSRRPNLGEIERDILAARAFRPSVETSLSSAESRRLMERVRDRLFISARNGVRIIEVARTIAALDKETVIGPAHLAEAIQYAPPEWRKRRNPSDNDDFDSFWGKPISVYTRAQAIEDGTLADLSAIVPDVCRQHYKYPVACTAAVWAIIDAAVRNKRYGNSVAGIVHDILWMSRVYKRQLSPDTVITRVTITGAGKKRLYDFKLVVGPGDNGEPVITLMLPEED